VSAPRGEELDEYSLSGSFSSVVLGGKIYYTIRRNGGETGKNLQAITNLPPMQSLLKLTVPKTKISPSALKMEFRDSPHLNTETQLLLLTMMEEEITNPLLPSRTTT
jgi:hypothetical protein